MRCRPELLQLGIKQFPEGKLHGCIRPKPEMIQLKNALLMLPLLHCLLNALAVPLAVDACRTVPLNPVSEN